MLIKLKILKFLIKESMRKIKSSSSKFNFNTLNKFEHLYEIHRYLSRNFRQLGAGSSRIAYEYTSHSVIKAAANKRGLLQNEAEVEIYTNPLYKPLVAKIFDFDPNYRWLVSEPVRSIRSNVEFKKYTGMELYELTYIASKLATDHVLEPYLIEKYDAMTQRGVEILEALVPIVKNSGLIIADLEELEHWGITADNRVVILDYGWTYDVFNSSQ